MGKNLLLWFIYEMSVNLTAVFIDKYVLSIWYEIVLTIFGIRVDIQATVQILTVKKKLKLLAAILIVFGVRDPLRTSVSLSAAYNNYNETCKSKYIF